MSERGGSWCGRRKALLALSCLTRHHDAAMDAFRAQGGLSLLLRASANSVDPRQRRCCPHIISPLTPPNTNPAPHSPLQHVLVVLMHWLLSISVIVSFLLDLLLSCQKASDFQTAAVSLRCTGETRWFLYDVKSA